MTDTILVVNAGSSSIKFQLFSASAGDQLQRRLKGQIEGIGVHPFPPLKTAIRVHPYQSQLGLLSSS